MKNIRINKTIFVAMIMLVAASTVFLSCSDDDGAPPMLDHASIIPKDSTLQSATRGDMIVIYGRNLATTKEVYFNGQLANLNTTLVRNDNIIVSIPNDAPYINAENKIVVVTDYGSDEISDFILTQDPVISSFTGVAQNGATISIKGQFLLGTEEVGFINVEAPDDTLWAEIVNIADEEVKVKVPDGTKIATIYLKAVSGFAATTTTFGLNYIIYAEGLSPSWENWSWSSEVDQANTTRVKSGDVSWRHTYTGGWGGYQIHYPGFDLKEGGDAAGAPLYTHLKFSIFGGSGTEEKEIIVTINWAGEYRIKLVPGKWTDYTIPLSTWNQGKLNELIMQDVGNTGITAPFLMYIDDVGFL